jgi:hypothetical protein
MEGMSGDTSRGRERKISDLEYRGYKAMEELEGQPNKWIYFSQCNRYAALVDVTSGDVLFEMDRKTGEKLYQSPKARKATVRKTMVIPKLYIRHLEERMNLQARSVA